MTILKSSKTLISALIIALAVSVPAFAASKAHVSEQKSVFAAGVNYGLGDSAFGVVVDYSGDNMWNLPLTLRGFYHSANSSVSYAGANVTYTNSVLGIADLYEFRNAAPNITPYIGIGYQMHNISANSGGVTLTANGATLFYTLGLKYDVSENIAVDLSYNNAGQADITSVTSGGATMTLNPAFVTNAGGITLGALYSF